MINTESRYKSSAYSVCRAGFLWSLLIFSLLFIVNAVLVIFASELEDAGPNATFFIRQFNFDDEGNFATWASSALLLITAIGCIAVSILRSVPYPNTSRLLLAMGIGFLVLSMDDVAEIHGFVEEFVAGTVDIKKDSNPAAEAFEDKLGPVLTGVLALLFLVVFFRPLATMAQSGNVRTLIGSTLCVVLAAITELTYNATSCDEDWCYQLSTLFEESFEFGAIFFFLVFLMNELFPTDSALPADERSALN